MTMYNSPVYDDPKYRCLCNTHVERGAYIIAFIGAVLAGLAAIINLMSGGFGYAIGEFIQIALYLSIIYAQKKREPNYYLPYLILTVVGIVLWFMVIIFLVVVIIVLPNFMVEHTRQGYIKANYEWDPNTLIRIFFAVEIVVISLKILLTIFFLSIVYRAYKFMKDEQDVRVPPPTLHKV